MDLHFPMSSALFRPVLIALGAAAGAAAPGVAQQLPDTAFAPRIAAPAFAEGRGPLVVLDEAHHNFHTVAGRYSPFVRLLRRDGFRVEPGRARFTAEALSGIRILVIANALPDSGPWVLPTLPAFLPDEVRAVERWVQGGGALLLIADHMPFGGAAERLAAAFGLVFTNSFAYTTFEGDPPLVFRRADGSLGADVITDGRDGAERVDSVMTFTGQGFRALRPVRPLLTLDSTVSIFLPVRAWEFSAQTPRISAHGMLQGAAFRHGRGRVAVFGEAAMFSAQVQQQRGDRRVGMNTPAAAQNAQFLLNVTHWLAGILEPDGPRS